MVYDYVAAGMVPVSDLNELKVLAREGQTIQVGIRQLFELAEDDQNDPEHILFAAIMQLRICARHA